MIQILFVILGFLLGYGVRSAVSQRRRARARLRASLNTGYFPLSARPLDPAHIPDGNVTSENEVRMISEIERNPS